MQFMDTIENTKPKPFCFVLMPFDESFDDIYNFGIKESCKEADAYCERVDEQVFQETILERIYNQISKADIIIADMTGRNPNVFYEVGYAHALGKLTILLTQKAEDIPFDLKHYTHIVYNNKITILKSELKSRIQYFIENPITSNKDHQIDFELYLEGESLSTNKVISFIAANENPYFKITIYNQSIFSYNSDDIKIGVITNPNYYFSKINGTSAHINNLPDGKKMHMVPKFNDVFFSKSYYTFAIELTNNNNNNNLKYKSDMIFRIYTKAGFRDYKLLLQMKN